MRQRNPLVEEKPTEGEMIISSIARPSRMKGPRTTGSDIRFDALRQRSLSRRRRRCAHSSSPDVRDEARVAERCNSRRGSRIFGSNSVDSLSGVQQAFEEDVFPRVDFAYDPGIQENGKSDSADMGSALSGQTPNLLPSQDWTPWFENLQHISAAPPRIHQADDTGTGWDSPIDSRATFDLTPGLSSSPSLSTSPTLALTTTFTAPQTRAISLRGPTGDWEAVIAMFDPTVRHSLLSQRTANVLGLNLVPLPPTKMNPRMTPFGMVYPQSWAHNVGVRCGAGSAPVPASIMVAPFEGKGVDVLIGCNLKEKLRREGTGAVGSLSSRSISCDRDEKRHGTNIGRPRRFASLNAGDGRDFGKTSGLGGMEIDYQGQYILILHGLYQEADLDSGDSVWQDPILDFAVPSLPFPQDALPISSLPDNVASIQSGDGTPRTMLNLNHFNVGLWGMADSPTSSSAGHMDRGLGDDGLSELFGSLP
ncbi:Fc.00g040520.m01.CDS01 [Cosmosporella sp. VM-42]